MTAVTDAGALKRVVEEMARAAGRLQPGRLEKRKQAELEFHDRVRNRAMPRTAGRAEQNRMLANRKFYAGASASKRYFEAWVKRHSREKIVLDCACGDGQITRIAAQAGARLAIGIDISGQSIKNARGDARRAGVAGNICFAQADVEHTRLPDGSIDVIICSGVLHHLDLSRAFREFRRILAPGGRILAYEALAYNPLIRLYRCCTPGMRTDWEKKHILSLADVRAAGRSFEAGEIRFWHITSVLARYAQPLLAVFNAIDAVLTRIPLVRLMAWIFTFELVKPREQR